MKKLLAPASTQKALALLMAAFVLALAVLIPVYSKTDAPTVGPEHSILLDASSYTDAPDLSLLPEAQPRLALLFFALPRLWAMAQELLAPEIREYRAVFLQFFIQKINFIFVSTLAP